MALRLGNANIERAYLGSTPLDAVFLGSTKIWEAPPLTYEAGGPGSTATAAPPAFDLTAPLNADIFVAVTVDRSVTMSGATYGGVAMTEIATVSHNNDASKGATKVYRLAKGGDGTAKAVKANGSGTAWWVANAVAISNVIAVGTPVAVYGNGNSQSQAVSKRGLWILSAGNNNATVGSFSGFTGATNRTHLRSSTGATQAISTVDAAGTAAAVLSTSSPWGAIFIPISSQ